MNNFQLNGSGMTIINPPWKLDTQLGEVLPELLAALGAEKSGQIRLEWTVPE
ncbi:MAG: 23S rRNA (adenine(2030)-N(6))-methyltransferase RlmJ [Sulfuricella sp.]